MLGYAIANPTYYCPYYSREKRQEVGGRRKEGDIVSQESIGGAKRSWGALEKLEMNTGWLNPLI